MLATLKPVSLPDSHESDGAMPCNVVSIDPFPAKDMAFLYGAVYSQIQRVLSEISHSPELTGKLQVMIAEDWARRIHHWPYTLLPIFSCAAAGGEMLRAGPVAAAWNLLHLAARIMDDLADDGAVIGFTPTLTMGEAAHISFTLVSLAHKLLDYLPQAGISLTVIYQIHSDLNHALMWACVGQYQDITHMTHPEFDLNSYWQMIENKTGHPFAWACKSGLAIGGGTSEQINHIQQYGFNLGILIQLFDDWAGLDIHRGKSDLALQKKTLPVLYALSVLPPRQRERLEVLLNQAGQSPEAAEEVRTEIIRLGGLQYTLVEAEIRRQRAQTALSFLPDGPEQKQLLALLNHSSPWLNPPA